MLYNEKFQEIEVFAKNLWEQKNVNKVSIELAKRAKIVLDFFPYPSGIGLHVGHTLGYIASDIYARYMRLRGYNVLYAMGFDSFGLPAEQFAIETGVHPEITTMQNIANMKSQLDILGLMHDKARSFSTTDASYYKWTQWIFIKLYNSYFDKEANKAMPIEHLEKKLRNEFAKQFNEKFSKQTDKLEQAFQDGGASQAAEETIEQMFEKTVEKTVEEKIEEKVYETLKKHRLAYLDDVEVNWCPKLGTVLSHEEVINGKSERGDHPVFKKKLKQWVLRITDYASRLLENLDELDWPASVKEMQRNWIGVSHGHEITFFECAPENGQLTKLAESIEKNRTENEKTAQAINMKQFLGRISVEPVLVANMPDDVLVDVSLQNNPFSGQTEGNIEGKIEGKTEGKIKINTPNAEHSAPFALTVFSTKLETISGATFCAISINHPLVSRLCKNVDAIAHLRKFKMQDKQTFNKTYQEDNANDEQMPDSFFTGSYVYNPINKRAMPVYIANYVLDYGTAAVMGVPAHDERDRNLALKHGLDIIELENFEFKDFKSQDFEFKDFELQNFKFENFAADDIKTKKSQIGPNEDEKNEVSENEGKENDQKKSEIKKAEIILQLEKHDFIKRKTNMKLRDWIFSRQRYWGEPFPIVLDQRGNAYCIEEAALPITLPKLQDFTTSDQEDILKPLDKLPEWKNVNFIKLDLHTARIVDAVAGSKLEINGKQFLVESGIRETNTMPNWAGSCWYYLRYMDPADNNAFASMQAQEYWSSKNLGCVDLYLGGAEHAVLHLLYARFWHMVLYDLGYVLNKEPFNKLVNQGMILGASYQDLDGKYYPPSEVEKKGEQFFIKASAKVVIEKIGKIGKRYKNGVPPQEVTQAYGVDAFRLYMMYLGPLEQNKAWNYSAIKGMSRFLEKVCAIEITDDEDSYQMQYDFYSMLHKVESDCQELKFHTAISAIIIFVNNYKAMSEQLYIKLIKVLAPFAPHLCEYLSAKYIGEDSIFNTPWPEIKQMEKQVQEITVVFSVNGKKKCVQKFSVKGNNIIKNDAAENDAIDNGLNTSCVENFITDENHTIINDEVLKAQAFEIEPNAKNIIIIRDNQNMPKLVNIVI